MSIPQVFRNRGQNPEPWTDTICDLVSRHMADAARSSPVLRKGGRSSVPPTGGKGAGEYQRKRGEALRRKHAAQVLEMHSRGGSIAGIASEVGCAKQTVLRIIEEAGA